ncbi:MULTISPECIES: hypothetical protein [Pseudomonas]|uniref:Uncharacterized protein n=1 Tax=Pseudomonas lutea TaxID=243924 RepID=A0A9X8QLS7_9PSED|nr:MULTISPECIES: hypothetical protein [Pseudomonas]SER37971.1 hypothetical protein SAMN05216409_118119 [Pseudomonas lutea]
MSLPTVCLLIAIVVLLGAVVLLVRALANLNVNAEQWERMAYRAHCLLWRNGRRELRNGTYTGQERAALEAKLERLASEAERIFSKSIRG